MPTAKEHVERIKSNYGQIDSKTEFFLDNLAGMMNTVQKMFPRYGSFLMEFIQNADDEKSRELQIEIFPGALRISNNGEEFSYEDVESICKVGRSSKKSRDYIGYLGVGFKAVFLISECPEVHSGEYHFKFDKNSWLYPERTPWQTIPIWVEETGIEFPRDFTTIFKIPLKDSRLMARLEEEMKPENLSARILLFLKNIQGIDILNVNQNLRRRIVKSESSITPDYGIYRIQEYENDALKAESNWLLFHRDCMVPPEVKEDYTTKDWERDNLDKSKVVVAFRLNKAQDLQIEEKGTVHMGVFSYLPLKEISSGLNFLIQADFLTTPGRAELARDNLWNDWLAREVYDIITEKAIPKFLEHEMWRMNFTQILYSNVEGHELFRNYVKEPLNKYLENNAVLTAVDGSSVEPKKAVRLINPDMTMRLVTEAEIEALYPSKKVLDSRCQVPWNSTLHHLVEDGPNFNSKDINSGMINLVKSKTRQNDRIEFFKRLYREMNYEESTLRRSPLRNEDIILTSEGNLADAQSVHIKPASLKISPEAESWFKLVHPDLVSDMQTLQWLKKLGVEDLTEADVQNALNEKQFPIWNKNWSSYLQAEKIEITKKCKELYENGRTKVENLSFIELEAKNKKWMKPSQLIFSKEYNPDHGLEELCEEGLLKKEDLERFGLEFLSQEYCIGDNGDRVKKWRDFLTKLGVERNAEQTMSKIAQKIAINVALDFERRESRTPHELTRAEESAGGLDIESGERLIEVKGRSEAEPKLELAAAQYRMLNTKGERYFVYIVRNVLRNPILDVIRGSNLLNIDHSISVDFTKWMRQKETEYRYG
jgi:hypothetical protein